MTTPDAEDASPSPEYSGDPDGSDMAVEQKTESHSGGASPAQKPASGSKSSNSKDPLRPRRKKARRACFACQRAHLTCGDERPCNRCIRRGLQDHCMDGVRKKAKYLHDAPDGALMPGVGGHYPHIGGNRPSQLPTQEPAAAPVAQQNNYYTHSQAPSAPYYAPNSASGQIPTGQDVHGGFGGQHPPMSPPYNQTNTGPVPNTTSTMSQGNPSQMQQYSGPLFDPSDPALFNFDISSLNFGNHYGALEFGMLGHMSSGAADTPPSDNNLMNPLNQTAGVYNPQMAPGQYPEHPNVVSHMSFGPDTMASTEWQNAQSRHGSMVQTPNNTPTTATLDHNGHRNDSLNGPHAYAIGQGPSSISSASPASTEHNNAYESENPLSNAPFFASANQQHAQHSPTMSGFPQEKRGPNTALQPIQSNTMRKRHQETKEIYEGISKPYNYVKGFHSMLHVLATRLPPALMHRANVCMSKFRPPLIAMAAELNFDDLVHQEKNLQRTLLTLTDHFAEVGTPSIICRRSGEIVGMNKEFYILTGWTREVLLGLEPNQNVNVGPLPDPSGGSGVSTQSNTTPTIPGQEQSSGPRPVNILELMDPHTSLHYMEDFADLAWGDSRGNKMQRGNLLRYLTKHDMNRIEEMRAKATHGSHCQQKPDSRIKHETAGEHQGEAGIRQLSAKDGMVDCMMVWHIKRDTFEVPMLVCMQVMPVLQSKA